VWKLGYGQHSKRIKDIEDAINDQTAHANIFSSQHNFLYVPGERAEIHTSYFDFEDEEWVKVDLWLCAEAGLIAIDLILAVQRQHGGFLPSSDALWWMRRMSSPGLARISDFCRAKAPKARCTGFCLPASFASSGIDSWPLTGKRKLRW
jgi:hypothetical protein